MRQWNITANKKMKKLMSLLLITILFIGTLLAESCGPEEGYDFYQPVAVYKADGSKTSMVGEVYKATNKCDTYRICWSVSGGKYDTYHYSVITSDKKEYKYMFWCEDGEKYYFNM